MEPPVPVPRGQGPESLDVPRGLSFVGWHRLSAFSVGGIQFRLLIRDSRWGRAFISFHPTFQMLFDWIPYSGVVGKQNVNTVGWPHQQKSHKSSKRMSHMHQLLICDAGRRWRSRLAWGQRARLLEGLYSMSCWWLKIASRSRRLPDSPAHNLGS